MTEWPIFAIRYQFGGREFSVYVRGRNFPDAEARLACIQASGRVEEVIFSEEQAKLGRKPDA